MLIKKCFSNNISETHENLQQIIVSIKFFEHGILIKTIAFYINTLDINIKIQA